MGNVHELNDADFDAEVLESDKPVLVDFWAPWCAPCRMLAPVVEELAVENSGSAKIFKLNIDENPLAAQRYNVSSIPTLIFFSGGQVVERLSGVQPKNRLQQSLDESKA